jgi:chromate transporter
VAHREVVESEGVDEALIKVAKRALKVRAHWVIAGLSFLAIFALGLPFPLIIATAALWGYWTATGTETHTPAPRPGHLLPTVAVWGGLWIAPILILWLSGAELLTSIAVFFSKLAVVTFGGAYAVLAYMTQTVVQDHGWVTTAAMMDGLGLAETTPGPLILVTQFIGFLAGHAEGGFALGLAAALVTLWVTFVPCFLWIFAGAPYLEWLAARPRLTGALAGVTAAVVGVILNLSIWFGVHVLFRDVGAVSLGPATWIWPDPASLDGLALALTLISATLLFALRWPLLAVLGLSALLGLGTGILAG